MIPLARPRFTPAELDAVAEVLASGMLVQGERVREFEQALADRAGRRHAVAVSSGTTALELALALLGVGPGDDVLCPALTWPSPAHAVLSVGAHPVLVDVHPDEWNAVPERYAEARNDRTKLAIVIDQFGSPARWPEISAALGDLPLIEDAACALGSELAGRPCGGFGRISTLSFHPRKVLTTGEGGALLTDDDALARRARSLRNHGQREPGVFECAAGNARMTEVAATLGVGQLRRLAPMLAERARLAARYRDGLAEWNELVAPQRLVTDARANHQTLGVRLLDGAPTRDTVIDRLREAGVGAGRLSYSLGRLPQFHPAPPTPVADELEDRGVALPLFETMTEAQVDEVLSALGSALRRDK